MTLPLAGRKVAIYDASDSPRVLIAGARTKTCSINGEPIDITNDDDDAFRTLLSDPAMRSIDLSVEGILKNTNELVKITASSPTLLEAYEIDFDTVGIISGNFYLASLELGGEYQNAVTFSASLQSSGSFAFTAA